MKDWAAGNGVSVESVCVGLCRSGSDAEHCDRSNERSQKETAYFDFPFHNFHWCRLLKQAAKSAGLLWTSDIRIALAMQGEEVAEIECEEDIRLRLAGGDQVHVIVIASATDTLFSGP